jgi:hypothetical protein
MDIFTDLFKEQDSSRANDPKYAHRTDDTEVKWPTLGSRERMRDLFLFVVKERGPTEAEYIKFTTTGECVANPDDPDKVKRVGYRTRVEYGERPIDPFVGQVKEAQWVRAVAAMTDRSNESTFGYALQFMQSNGDWVPLMAQCKFDKALTMDGKGRAVDREREPVRNATWHPDVAANQTTQPTETAIDVLRYAIVWVDRKNAKDLIYNAKGELVPEQNVSVRSELSAATIEAIRGSGGGGTDPRLVDAIYAQGAALGEMAESVKALADKPASPVSVSLVPGKPGRPRKVQPVTTGEGGGK